MTASNQNSLPLTHEFVALMKGVRRAGVTEAIHELVGLSLIATARGRIVVLDRKAIEKIAGAFYGAPEAEYHRLIGKTDHTQMSVPFRTEKHRFRLASGPLPR